MTTEEGYVTVSEEPTCYLRFVMGVLEQKWLVRYYYTDRSLDRQDEEWRQVVCLQK